MKKKIREILNETHADREVRAGKKFKVTALTGKKPWGVMPWFRNKPGTKPGTVYIVGDPLTASDVDLRTGRSLELRHSISPVPLLTPEQAQRRELRSLRSGKPSLKEDI